MNFDNFVASLSDEQKQKLMQGLMEASEKESVEEAVSSKPQSSVTEDFKVKREQAVTGKAPVKFKKNKWEDQGEFKEVETPDFKRTPRKRNAPNKKTVECHVCGKEFSINANLVYGEYMRCNRCTGR